MNDMSDPTEGEMIGMHLYARIAEAYRDCTVVIVGTETTADEAWHAILAMSHAIDEALDIYAEAVKGGALPGVALMCAHGKRGDGLDAICWDCELASVK